MPLASMVSTLLMGLPANSRFHSRAISRNRGISIWWLMKLSTFSTPAFPDDAVFADTIFQKFHSLGSSLRLPAVSHFS